MKKPSVDTHKQIQKYIWDLGKAYQKKVFISNSHSLNNLALELSKHLQSLGIEFFHYQINILTSTNWQSESEEKLKECKILVALINNEYHLS